MAALWDAATEIDVLDCYERLRRPLLAVYATQRGEAAEAAGHPVLAELRRMEARLPLLHVASVDTHHDLIISRPQETAELVARFVRTHV